MSPPRNPASPGLLPGGSDQRSREVTRAGCRSSRKGIAIDHHAPLLLHFAAFKRCARSSDG